MLLMRIQRESKVKSQVSGILCTIFPCAFDWLYITSAKSSTWTWGQSFFSGSKSFSSGFCFWLDCGIHLLDLIEDTGLVFKGKKKRNFYWRDLRMRYKFQNRIWGYIHGVYSQSFWNSLLQKSRHFWWYLYFFSCSLAINPRIPKLLC